MTSCNTLLTRTQSTEILIPCDDWNGQVGAPVSVLSDAYGGHGFGTHNKGTRKILEFVIANGHRISSTWCKKRNTHLIAYNSGSDSNQLDYIIYRKSFSSAVSNMTDIPDEECTKEHYMVVCDFTAHIPCVKKGKFSCPASVRRISGTQLLQASSSQPSR